MKTAKTSFLDLPPECPSNSIETTALNYRLSPLESIAYKENSRASRTATVDPIVHSINSNAASLQLLMTCKLCPHEGLPVLEGENELIIEKCSDLQYLIKLWSPKARGRSRPSFSRQNIEFKWIELRRSVSQYSHQYSKI